MAENESLDLGGNYSKRWNVPYDAIRKREPCADVARSLEVALIGFLRRSFVQCEKEYGVSLSDLVDNRHDPVALRYFVRKTHGHQYIRLFADAAASSGDSSGEFLRGGIDAILDAVCDQMCQGKDVLGTQDLRTVNDLQHHLHDVRRETEPELERIVTNLERDPNWKPKRAPSRARTTIDPTSQLLEMSLLGGARK